MVWMKGIMGCEFSVSAANVRRGVAELLMNPVSQGWKAKPNQK